MIDHNILKPLITFGMVLIVSSFLGLVMFYVLVNDPKYDSSFSYFIAFMVVVHFFVGLGVVLKKSWGLALFKCYLYILLLGFPIGTYIAIKTLKYIKHYHVHKYFV